MKATTSDSIKLSSKHTIADYLRMEKEHDRQRIAELIRLRHRERYVNPVERSTAKHGFASMALACPLIETIQSFREGLGDTKRRSRDLFRIFLKHEPKFAIFAGIADRFFEDVRCGLLHQGETRNGWTVMRLGPLFDPLEKQLNATRFLKAVYDALVIYCNELEQADWNDEKWIKCRKKMAAIIANCEG
jgi:hypothetical protein